MSGVAEASLVLGIISSIISIVNAAKEIYETAHDKSGLPKAFKNVHARLPLVSITLQKAKEYTDRPDLNQATCDAFKPILEQCAKRADKLGDMFSKIVRKDGVSRLDRYWIAARKLGEGGRVERLMEEILEDCCILTNYFSLPDYQILQKELVKAIEEVSKSERSLPAHFETLSFTAFNHQTRTSKPQASSVHAIH